MKKLHVFLIGFAIATLMLGLSAWGQVHANNDSKAIVGVWFVKAPDAPFQYHMFTFHADGTMQQSNPDAGNPNTSDSDGHGVWVKNGKMIKGKFVEATADRSTNAFASRGEISFEIDVNNNDFTGTASAFFYDEDNNVIRGPLDTPLEGKRVTLP